MNKIIIGSAALNKWYGLGIPREAKDLDYAVYSQQLSNKKEVEYLWNPILFKYPELVENQYLIPDALYTLKLSHMFWNIEGRWNKDLYDIQFLKDKGCKVIDNLFYDLYEFWNEYHGKNKRSNLEMSAENFFDNAIKFPVKHDDLHDILIQHSYFKNQDKPTYNKILIGEVDVCMDKFAELSIEDKINVVQEEVMIMAAERCGNMNYRLAYDIMLKKFIQNHCKIEEGVWILDNFKLVRKPSFNYVEFLNIKIKELELCS